MRKKVLFFVEFSLILAFMYSTFVYQTLDIKKFHSCRENGHIDYIIDRNDICLSVQSDKVEDEIDKIYVKCTSKYMLSIEEKLSLVYNSDYVLFQSFEKNVYKKNLTGIKCIENSSAPASSYHGVLSWFTNFNLVGSNITEVTITFEIVNNDVDWDKIVDSFYLRKQ